MYKKILILSVSAGDGHLRAAAALETEFRRLAPECEIRNIDALNYTNRVFRRLYGRGYIDLVQKAPSLYGWMYNFFNRPGSRIHWARQITRANARPLLRLIDDWRPDYVLSTHFATAELMDEMRARGALAIPHGVVVTDLNVHSLYFLSFCDHYFVALDEGRAQLEARGISRSRITVSGIPIDPRFADPRDKSEARRDLGLDPEKTTIFVTTGGAGIGPIEMMTQSLLSLPPSVQVVLNCGRNEAARTRAEALVAQRPGNPSVQVIGFTTAMHEYLSASDILVGKPGGLTLSEAVAKGLAFIIVHPIPGQEEGNADRLLEEGVALRCNDLAILAYKIEQLLADPDRLARMQANARRLARPQAAQTIAQRILQTNADVSG